MKTFSAMGIVPTLKPFTGDKVSLSKILNKEITVLDFKIEPSKFADKGNGKCLNLHIILNGENRVIFTSGIVLQDIIQKVQKDDFPFTTIIVKVDDHYEFS